MGDRVLIRCIDNTGSTSPLLYLHWGATAVESIIRAAAPDMRRNDVAYAFARLVAYACTVFDPPLGVGVFTADDAEIDRHMPLVTVNVSDGTAHIEGEGVVLRDLPFATE